MSVTSGFFNHKNQDRLYDATQLSKLFIGLISINGVYSSVGNRYEQTKNSQLCINPFELTIVDPLTFKIGKGLVYFKGYYFYNDSDYILTIPQSEGYPVNPFKALTITKDPQLEYPSGNPIDLGGIQVKEIESTYTILDIKLNGDVQLDYPSGNALDLGNLEVDAYPSNNILTEIVLSSDPQLDYPEGATFDIGDISVKADYSYETFYIIIDFNEYDRILDLKVVTDIGYNYQNRLILYEIRRAGSEIKVVNYMSLSRYDGNSTKVITGLMTYCDNAQQNLNSSTKYHDFMNEWIPKINKKFEDWLSLNSYYLTHSDEKSQYDRMDEEVNNKDEKPYVKDWTLSANTTSEDIQIDDIDLSNKLIKVISNPYGLSINDIEVNDNVITLKYYKITLDYNIKIIIR